MQLHVGYSPICLNIRGFVFLRGCLNPVTATRFGAIGAKTRALRHRIGGVYGPILAACQLYLTSKSLIVISTSIDESSPF